MPEFKIGSVVENSMRQFTKIISYRRGIYGLSGWTSRANAEKATNAVTFVNKYGLEYAGAKTVSKGGSTKDKSNAPEVSDDAPTKAEITKLSADEAKALHKKVVGSEVETGKAAKDGLVAFYKL